MEEGHGHLYGQPAGEYKDKVDDEGAHTRRATVSTVHWEHCAALLGARGHVLCEGRGQRRWIQRYDNIGTL